MKKVKDLKKELERINEEMEIGILAPNGFVFEPKIKRELKDQYKVLDYSDDNTKRFVLHWD